MRGVLFDLDGTLVDSYAALTASVNHLRARYGLEPLEEAQVREEVGWGLRNLLAKTVPGVPFEEAARQFAEHHATVVFDQTRLLPGVAETLRRLHQEGLKLGVVSNKPEPFVRALMEHFGLAPLLEVMMGPESAPHPKPHPDLLLKALERMGLQPEEALYVGDMTIDIETARRAGMAVWVIPTGSHSRERLEAAHPDRILERFEELVALAGHR